MKLLVDLPAELIERINAALAQTRGGTLSNFVQLAIENQLSLERQPEGPLGAKAASQTTPAPPQAMPSWTATLRREAIAWDQIRPVATLNAGTKALWGQYNRLFPAKFAVRVLADLQGRGTEVPLADYHARGTTLGVQAKDDLDALDREQDVPRGERRSAAFPQDTELSRRRFAEQFLGSRQANGQVIGLLPELGFIEFQSGKSESVALTSAGFAFAKLPNPLVDGPAKDAEPFTTEEARFLIAHLRTHLAPEFEFLTGLLEAIAGGANTPDTLLTQVQAKYPEWEAKQAQTMRNGAMGRLHDLGLLGRERTGLRVTYHVQPHAADLLRATPGSHPPGARGAALEAGGQ